MRWILIACGTAALLAAAHPGFAQDGDRSEMTVRERVEAELLTYRDQLALSDYQFSQVELILKSGIRERVAIAQRYGLDEFGDSGVSMDSKEQRRMLKELKQSRKDTAERMERYLDKDQMKAFKQFQEERSERLLAQLDPDN